MTSNLRRQTRRTVQSRTRETREMGMGFLFNMARAGEIIAPWWSRHRDKQLTDFLLSSDAAQGAFWMIGAKLVNVPHRVEARDRGIKAHVELADQYQAILENMIQFGQGWSDFWNRFLNDLWTTDNGAFGEVIGARGNPGGPLKGPPIGLSHLDSLRCTRTSNPEFPVVYTDTDGKRYKFHHTRIIFTSQEASGRSEMNGVGHCWLSRCINNAQRLVDKDVYFQEALGSRPKREILLTKGIDPDDFLEVISMADEGMDNQGLRRYSKTVVAGDRNRTDIGVDRIPLSFIPDGFDEAEVTRIGMAFIALAGGFPLRWVWPASATGATKADAMFQHIAGVGGGSQWHLNKMRDLLSYSDKALAISNVLPPKFIPKELRLVFDFQDDEQDRQQADVRKARADTRKIDLEDSVIDVRTAREQALSADDITQAQFNRMELDAGRLPNGDDVLAMYDSNDLVIQDMLDLGVDEPLLIDAHDPIDMLVTIVPAALAVQARMVQAGGRAEREKARQALAALGKLKGIYEQLASEAIEEEIAAEQATEAEQATAEAESGEAGEGEEIEAAEGESEAADEEKATTDDELLTLILDDIGVPSMPSQMNGMLLKAFDFGARVGQRIRGSLFRGAGGKFASEGELNAVKNEILRRLIERLRAKRAGGAGGKKRGAAKKKPKGGGGGKPKPSAEELARKKREGEKRRRAEVLDTAAKSFEVDAADLEALAQFIDGAELDPSTAQRMAQSGLVRFDADGRVFATTEGKAFIRAANKGETRQATEAMSRGVERVRKVQGRIEDRRERAGKAQVRATELDARADELTAEADKLLENAEATEDPSAADRLRERAEKKREQAAKATADAQEQREKAADLDASADKLGATIGEVKKNKVKSIAGFEAALTGAVTGLWSGTIGTFTFIFTMQLILRQFLTEAWEKGAKDCGISPDEMTDAEKSAMNSFINGQIGWVIGFAADIQAHSQAGGHELEPLLVRMQLWVLRYNEARERGKAMACADKKLMWVLGIAEHCKSCIRLNGKVKRASVWAALGIIPRVAGAVYLICRGYNCQCNFVETDKPVSRGPLPSLP